MFSDPLAIKMTWLDMRSPVSCSRRPYRASLMAPMAGAGSAMDPVPRCSALQLLQHDRTAEVTKDRSKSRARV